MKYVTSVDLTSLNALKVFMRTVKEAGGILIISGVKSELNSLLQTSNVTSDIGVDNIFMSENEIFASSTNALEKARAALSCDPTDDEKKICIMYATRVCDKL